MFEQHIINDMSVYSMLLKKLDLSNMIIIEFGVGTGLLTQSILEQRPYKLIGYEISQSIISENLCKNPCFDLKIMDFTLEDFSYLKGQNYGIIANPPYEHLHFIKKIIDTYPPKGVILMVSKKKKEIFKDYDIILEFGSNDFTPPTRGGHYVIMKGY